jgi:N6-L-threonylcarbamoyladenine synthase
MIVLGVESSCDETAAAVVQNGNRVLSSVVASQEEVHKKYGGVVPELASRCHIENIIPVITAALDKGGNSLQEITGIAVTQGPGLMGSLLVGLSTAKALAYVLDVPLVGVNHVEGHIAATFLENPDLSYPFVALVVSGGHTSLFNARRPGDYALLGQTRDDAAGEAFDKVAKSLRLGYPGGIVIDKLSETGNKEAYPFPRARMSDEPLAFSFSGLKTAVITTIRKRKRELSRQEIADVAASFQEAVVEVLVEKLFLAAQQAGLKTIVVCGGVACNRRLRQKLQDEAGERACSLYIPSPALCTDNAAMIAAAGTPYLISGQRAPLDMDGYSRLPVF